MELIRVLRILRHRWLTVTAIVVGTVAIAIATATYRNNHITPVNRAEAPISFISAPGDTGADEGEGELSDIVEAELEEARTRAIEVNAELLADPANEIVVDSTLGRLTFVSRHEDPVEAIAAATEMRQRFLSRQPVNMESQIDERLAVLSEQMEMVRQQMDELDARMSPPREVVARRQRLTTLRAQLEERALQLEQQILLPPGGEDAPTVDELHAGLASVEAAIDAVNAEIAQLPTDPSEFSPEMIEWRALERQFRELEATYQELVLQRSEVSESPQVLLVDVFDETPKPIPRRLAATVALILGIGLAVVVLLLTEKIRRPLWFPADVPNIPFLGSVPGRQPTPLPWYLQTGDNARKAAIQTLRSSIRARSRGSETVIGLASSGVDGDSVRMLAADLALGFASTRTATALIDASSSSYKTLPELSKPELSLSEIARETMSADELAQRLEGAIGHERSIHDHLVTIGGGRPEEVTSDVIASPQIGQLFDQLRELMDVVVVLTGDIASPTTRAALDRTDMVIVAARPGKTTQGSLLNLSDEMAVSDVEVLGVMLPKGLTPRLREAAAWLKARFSSSEREKRRAARTHRARRWGQAWRDRWTGAELDHSPQVSTIGGVEAAVDAEAANMVVDDPAVAGPIVRVVPDSHDRQPTFEPAHLLERLTNRDPAEEYGLVQGFIVEWVTRIVEARDGSGLLPETVQGVEEAGFVPLSTWRNNPSVGSRLRAEWRSGLGRSEASRLENLVLKSLGAGEDDFNVTSLDRWIGRRYFGLHARWTDWEPTVWHVTSPHGTLSALIAATRLDGTRIERFVDGIIIRAIERLARKQRRAAPAEQEELERQIEDVRSLGLALAWLMDGSNEESRLWYPSLPREQQPVGWQPDWAQGVKSNIAPLQRMGILAEPVLTEEELEVLDPTG